MKQYLNLVQDILKNGENRSDRTGTGTLAVFGRQLRFDLRCNGFPLMTTKKIFTKGIIHELLWFLKGGTNIKYLLDNGVHIWDEWATEEGDLSKVYGHQWVHWDWYDEYGNQFHINQIEELIQNIRRNPFSRRHVISAWNVRDLADDRMSPQENVQNGRMALSPCHIMFQFFVSQNKELSCHLYMRSVDTALGMPFNIASYSLLTHMIAQQCGLQVGDFILSTGDNHIYMNHIENLQKQIERVPCSLPTLKIKKRAYDIFSYEYDDFEFINYVYHPALKFDISV